MPVCAPSLQVLIISFPGTSSTTLAVRFKEMPNLRSFGLSWNVAISPSSMHELIHLQYLHDLTVIVPDDFDIDMGPSMQLVLPSLQLYDSPPRLNQLSCPTALKDQEVEDVIIAKSLGIFHWDEARPTAAGQDFAARCSHALACRWSSRNPVFNARFGVCGEVLQESLGLPYSNASTR